MVLVLWHIEFSLFLVESRGYRIEGQGVVVFIHLFIQFFFYFWAEQQWRIVWLGKISEKTYLKKGIVAEIQWSLLTEIRYSRPYFTNLNSNLSAVQKYDILVTKPLQAAGMSDDKVRGWDIFSDKWIFYQEAKLRGQMWNFEDDLSAEQLRSFCK